MKWTLKLITEGDSGQTEIHEVANGERAEAFIKPTSLGMSIEESKQIAASLSSWRSEQRCRAGLFADHRFIRAR